MRFKVPEIAEVETVKRFLKTKILQKKIIDINIIYPKIIENDLIEFKNLLIDQTFINIKRKGKYLIFETKNNYLISHLRMEGKYYIKNKNDVIEKHEHIIFIFEDFTDLRYHDTRKFGRMKLIDKNEYDIFFKKQGKEPTDLTFLYLKEKLKKNSRKIKTILLDQSIISGLGNIYANEVLYDAKINPYKLGIDLSDEDINNIIISSQKIVEKAILEGGTTIKSYTSSLGVAGNYQKYLKVHMKKDCSCGNNLIKEKIDGRSAYYCPNCQK